MISVKFPNIEYECFELKKVLLLMEANRDKIYMQPSQINKYSINREKIEEVVKNIREHSCLTEEQIENSIIFFRRIMEIMRYVNFNEFLDVIKKMCCEIKKFLIENHENYDVIFFGGLDHHINKSYTWILFLFLSEMSKLNFFDENSIIRNKIYVGNEKLRIKKPFITKVLYLFFDDMSYSGTQIADQINYRFLTTDDITRQYIPIPNLDIYITVPFISETAKSNISSKSFIKYWRSSQTIFSLQRQFFEGIPESQIQKYREIYTLLCTNHHSKHSGFQCNERIIPIYFDHKIADSYSTFNKLLYFGIYPINTSNPSCSSKCILTPLINNCEQNKDVSVPYLPNNNYCLDYIIDIRHDIICPTTFYKSIDYYFPPPYPSFEIIKQYLKDNHIVLTLISLLNYYDTRTTVFNSGITTSSSVTASALNKYLLEYENLDYKRKYNKYKEKYLELKKNKNI